MNPAHVAAAFRQACRAELEALKPGNVHRYSAGHGMDVAHFEAAADAAAPWIAAAGTRVGVRIAAAVEASFDAAGLNTNLGIVLLCVPLAAAVEAGGPLRARVGAVLERLDIADANHAFRAIARVSPGGLGHAPAQDVAHPATTGLREAMALAQDRDCIARQYANGFADVFDIGVARLAASGPATPQARTEAVHLAFMAAFPDSHIARKFGLAVARQVQDEAARLEKTVAGAASEAARHPPLLAFDAALKVRGLNPGTSADLTVASLFAHALSS